MDRRELELLDALEDARDQVKHDRRQYRALLLSFIGSLMFSTGGFIMLSGLHGMHYDLGSASGTPYVITLIFSVLCGVGAAVVTQDMPRNYKALKDAERDYRNYLSGYKDEVKEINRKLPRALKHYGLTDPRLLRTRKDGTQIWIDDDDGTTYTFSPSPPMI